jgi:archaeal cell division control protein 6
LDFRAIEEEYRNKHSVFKDKRALSLSYIPSTLLCREKEKKALAKILVDGINEGFLPPMIRIFGSTGTGKTVIVRSVLEKFSDYQKDIFRFFYVNLKNSKTVFSASNAILSAVCGKRVQVNLGIDRVFSEIWKEIGDLKQSGALFLCLVLDEVDSIFLDKHFNPSDFFYRILRASNNVPDVAGVKICLITITNNQGVLEENLDARVKSSMGSDIIHFPSYSRDELEQILESRVNEAFKPKMVSDRVVKYGVQLISEKGNRDVRKAIDLLRVSGEIANEKVETVSMNIISIANQKVEENWITDILNSLPAQLKVVLFVLTVYSCKIKKKTTTREAYNYYSQVLHNVPKKIGERRFLDIIKELETYGFLSTWNVSKGRRGYKKEIVINIDPKIVIECVTSPEMKDRYFKNKSKFREKSKS